MDASDVHVHDVPAQALTALVGQTMDGVSVSTTVILKLQSAVLPQASVAVQVLVIE